MTDPLQVTDGLYYAILSINYSSSQPGIKRVTFSGDNNFKKKLQLPSEGRRGRRDGVSYHLDVKTKEVNMSNEVKLYLNKESVFFPNSSQSIHWQCFIVLQTIGWKFSIHFLHSIYIFTHSLRLMRLARFGWSYDV